MLKFKTLSIVMALLICSVRLQSASYYVGTTVNSRVHDVFAGMLNTSNSTLIFFVSSYQRTTFIPHLSIESGGSKIEQNTGDLATPCFGFQSPETEKDQI